MVRQGGIEPPLAAYQATVLPLNYRRKIDACGAPWRNRPPYCTNPVRWICTVASTDAKHPS